MIMSILTTLTLYEEIILYMYIKTDRKQNISLNEKSLSEVFGECPLSQSLNIRMIETLFCSMNHHFCAGLCL